MRIGFTGAAREQVWSILRHRFWFVPGLAKLVTTAEMRQFDVRSAAMSEEEIAYFLTQTKGAGALWYLEQMRGKYGVGRSDSDLSETAVDDLSS